MEFSLSIFLFFYLVYLLFFAFFSYFNLYHIKKYGAGTNFGYVMTVLYLAVTLAALFVSYYYLAQINWDYTFELVDIKKLMF